MNVTKLGGCSPDCPGCRTDRERRSLSLETSAERDDLEWALAFAIDRFRYAYRDAKPPTHHEAQAARWEQLLAKVRAL